MNLKKKIEEDLTRALKDKNPTAIASLRFLLSAIHNEEIAKKKRDKLTDEEISKVIFSLIKKHKDSIEAFQKGSRQDLVEKEKSERQIIEKYLPKQLSKEAINKIVQDVIDRNRDQSLVFGRIMGLVMKEIKGQADGKLVNEIVRKELEEKD